MKIKIGFFSLLILVSLIMTHSYFAVGAILAVIFHELGHILTAHTINVRFKEMKIGIYGARLLSENNVFSYKNEIVICAMGPVTNFVLALLMTPIYKITNSRIILYFILSSVILGALNILPIISFDGGRILHAFICTLDTPQNADKILYAISFVTLFILWSLSIYLLLTSDSGLSMFVFSLSLFSRFFISE